MCVSALTWLMLICLWTVIVRIQGAVFTVSSLTAMAGEPVTLGCNVTTATGEEVKQVRWMDEHGQKLLTYLTVEPVVPSFNRDDVELSSLSRSHVSLIIIKMAESRHKGCYRCVFDIYPSGAQEGKTCLRIEGKVSNEGNRTAVSGKPITLSCWYSLPDRVHQVLWRKTAEQGDTSKVASLAKKDNPSVEEPYRDRATLSLSLGNTQLSIRPVRTEDEGCYTCEFHTYPDGTRSATACLFVYVLPEPAITYVTSDGVVEANCTATSRPPAQMVWNVEGDNRTLGPSVSSSYSRGDGTTLVTSTLLLQEGLLHDTPVKCVVHHQGLDSPISVNLKLSVGSALTTLISLSCLAALLICTLCVCFCKCFLCRDD
ncbi:OX-2 membrane glycoprotein-like [Esox lucius]|uniref:Ig-like domain-containing protein n=1 Tax=Esox lucius TaxID=8010 RepID=A0A6Q2Y9M6_ESOLU|nr:OX-2 membrane glycoprotein-like [Esox lucius]XP_034145452.1 OX-2 membrane glycoprotein-like [Esox lucius]